MLNGNKVRLRSPAHVVDEIEDLLNMGVKSFMFADALFTLPLHHASEICHEIIRRRLKVSWSAWAEPHFITKEFLLLAREGGCTSIAYSPDAMSDEALEKMGRRINKADIIKVYNYAKEIKGIKTGFGFFVSAPGETLKGFFETLSFFIRSNIMLKLKRRGGVGLSWIRLEPGTKLYEIALSEGIITRDTDLLPEPDSVRWKELFYVNRSLRIYNKLAHSLLALYEFAESILAIVRRKDGQKK
jgi:radical SAM superfamily enzyme YgiQ (UPF0313 family)